ncbi:DUF4232 domain-containing protein [Streptomyces sp. NPDC054841]
MRTIRTRATIAATAALLAGLSLTACQSDDKAKAADQAGGGNASATAPKAPEATPPSGTGGGTAPATPADGNGKGSGKGTSGGGNASNGSSNGSTSGGNTSTGGSSGSGTSPVTCTGENSKVVVSKVTRPINHLLLTVTNTGSRPCDAYHAPLLRFDEEQSATQIVDDSRPQAVVTLAPGQSAYASIILSGERAPAESHGYAPKQLGVNFAPRNNSGSTGAPVNLKLPAGTFKTDDAAVTYWLSDMSDALTY